MIHAADRATAPDLALLREVHEALDLLEHHSNRMHWQRGSGSQIDLVVRLRNYVIAAFPLEPAVEAGPALAENSDSGVRNDQPTRRVAQED